MTSVDHLHLHCFVLPITNPTFERVIYGSSLAPTSKIIHKIESGIIGPNPVKSTKVKPKM